MKSFNLSWENLSQFHTFGTFRILCAPEVISLNPEPAIPDSIAVIESLNGGDIGLRGTTDHISITYRQEAFSYYCNSSANQQGNHQSSEMINQTLDVRWVVSEDEYASITEQLTDDLNSSIGISVPIIREAIPNVPPQYLNKLNYLPRYCNWTVPPTATIWITTPSGTSPGYTFNLSIDAEPEWGLSLIHI